MEEKKVARTEFGEMPDSRGYFGDYGGQILPPHLVDIMNEIDVSYEKLRQTEAFQAELDRLNKNFIGRPSPIFHAERLSKDLGGAQIFFKREDLNHTGVGIYELALIDLGMKLLTTTGLLKL